MMARVIKKNPMRSSNKPITSPIRPSIGAPVRVREWKRITTHESGQTTLIQSRWRRQTTNPTTYRGAQTSSRHKISDSRRQQALLSLHPCIILPSSYLLVATSRGQALCCLWWSWTSVRVKRAKPHGEDHHLDNGRHKESDSSGTA